MQLVRVENLKPGLRVARPLLDTNGSPLLRTGVILSLEYIHSIRHQGFTHVFVQDPRTPMDVMFEDDLSSELRMKAVGAVKELFHGFAGELGVSGLASFHDMMEACHSEHARQLTSKSGVLKGLEDIIESISTELAHKKVLNGLSSIKSHDNQLYLHSVNVCVIAIMLGRIIDLPMNKLKPLAYGALLHDVGKVFVRPELDHFTRVRYHTMLGFELLKASPDAELLAPYAALEHHERQDGAGLPRGLIGSNTIGRNRNNPPPVPTLIGEITALANAFDNMLSGPHPVATETVIQIVSNHAGTRFNKELVAAFRRVVPLFPVGTEVVVVSREQQGFVGIVTGVHEDDINRPEIALYMDNAGRLLDAPVEMDLRDFPDVVIRARIS